MTAIDVFIVDDSFVVRRILTRFLEADPSIKVAGSAPDGTTALEKLKDLEPDIVTLDIEMPGMNGLETLTRLKAMKPDLPVLVISSLTRDGASTTLEALSDGASDYVAKPTQLRFGESGVAAFKKELISKIKALNLKSIKKRRETPSKPISPKRIRTSGTHRIDLVLIGVSTGGPNALATLLPTFPEGFPPVLIVQHMPPTFTKQLAERLDSNSILQVREAEGGETILKGQAWIAPGGKHMVVGRVGSAYRLALTEDPPENSCRPAVDVLFRSAASAAGEKTIGIVMTGMGHDGLNGCRSLKEAGSRIFVQDEESSVVWGMPGIVVENGIADEILPLSTLGPSVVSVVNGIRTGIRV